MGETSVDLAPVFLSLSTLSTDLKEVIDHIQEKRVNSEEDAATDSEEFSGYFSEEAGSSETEENAPSGENDSENKISNPPSSGNESTDAKTAVSTDDDKDDALSSKSESETDEPVETPSNEDQSSFGTGDSDDKTKGAPLPPPLVETPSSDDKFSLGTFDNLESADSGSTGGSGDSDDETKGVQLPPALPLDSADTKGAPLPPSLAETPSNEDQSSFGALDTLLSNRDSDDEINRAPLPPVLPRDSAETKGAPLPPSLVETPSSDDKFSLGTFDNLESADRPLRERRITKKELRERRREEARKRSGRPDRDLPAIPQEEVEDDNTDSNSDSDEVPSNIFAEQARRLQSVKQNTPEPKTDFEKSLEEQGDLRFVLLNADKMDAIRQKFGADETDSENDSDADDSAWNNPVDDEYEKDLSFGEFDRATGFGKQTSKQETSKQETSKQETSKQETPKQETPKKDVTAEEVNQLGGTVDKRTDDMQTLLTALNRRRGSIKGPSRRDSDSESESDSDQDSDDDDLRETSDAQFVVAGAQYMIDDTLLEKLKRVLVSAWMTMNEIAKLKAREARGVDVEKIQNVLRKLMFTSSDGERRLFVQRDNPNSVFNVLKISEPKS